MDKKPFQLPESILKQLNEFSQGGYILFRVNDDGNPEVYVQFDNMINAVGLTRYAASWANSIDQLNENAVMEGLLGGGEEDDEE